MEHQRIDYQDLTGIERKARRKFFWKVLADLDLYTTWVVRPEWIGLNSRLIAAEWRREQEKTGSCVEIRMFKVQQGILCIRVDDRQGNNDATS